MIEAVNSVIASASLLNYKDQQVEAASTNTVPLDSVSQGPVAPYVDRYSVNTDFDTTVLEVRDNDTGDVLKQFPAESTLEARQRAESVRARAQALQENAGPRVEGGASNRSSGSAPQVQPSTSAPIQVAISQQNAPQSSAGAGVAQAAIAALSLGANSGQSFTGTVSLSA